MKSKILGLLAVGLLAGPMAANAAVVIDLTEVGPNVVATLSGDINLDAFVGSSTANAFSGFSPTDGIVSFGSGPVVDRRISATGWTSFGSGSFSSWSSTSGDTFVMFSSPTSGFDSLALVSGYVSGASLASTGTKLNATFAALGMTTGTYVTTFTGATGISDTVTINVGPRSVPEPGTLALLGLGLAGLGLSRRRKAA